MLCCVYVCCAKIPFLEKLKQFSKKCLLLQDVCDVLYVVCVFSCFVCRDLGLRVERPAGLTVERPLLLG